MNPTSLILFRDLIPTSRHPFSGIFRLCRLPVRGPLRYHFSHLAWLLHLPDLQGSHDNYLCLNFADTAWAPGTPAARIPAGPAGSAGMP